VKSAHVAISAFTLSKLPALRSPPVQLCHSFNESQCLRQKRLQNSAVFYKLSESYNT